MRDNPISNVGPSGAEMDDETIQSGWDDFAMRDHIDESVPGQLPQDFTSRSSIVAAEVFGSRRVYRSPMEFGDAFTRAQSIDYAVEDAPDDRGEH